MTRTFSEHELFLIIRLLYAEKTEASIALAKSLEQAHSIEVYTET